MVEALAVERGRGAACASLRNAVSGHQYTLSVGARRCPGLSFALLADLAPGGNAGRARPQGRDRRALGLLFIVRSEEHTSELQSLMRISFDVFCLTQKNNVQL